MKGGGGVRCQSQSAPRMESRWLGGSTLCGQSHRGGVVDHQWGNVSTDSTRWIGPPASTTMTSLDVLLSLFVYCSGPSGRPRALLTEGRSVRPSYRRQQTVCSVCLDTSCAINDHEDTNHQAATTQAMPGEALHTRRRLQVVHCVTANRCTGLRTHRI